MLASIATLAGCYDFVGDAGTIGFQSNLRVDFGPWRPRTPVAGCSPVRLWVTEVPGLGEAGKSGFSEEDPASPGVVTAALSGAIAESTAADLAFVAPARGWVEATFTAARLGGSTADGFAMRSLPARRARVLTDPWHVKDGAIAVVGDEPIDVMLDVRGPRGVVLAYDPGSVALIATGDVSVVSDPDSWSIATTGRGDLDIRYLDRSLGSLHVERVTPEQVVSFEVFVVEGTAADTQESIGTARPKLGERWAMVVARTADGTRVRGLPVTWSFAGKGSADTCEGTDVATCGEFALVEHGEATVSWQAFTARVPDPG